MPASATVDLARALQAIRSADVREQNDGVARAIEHGAAAVPGLLGLLDDAGASRAQVMYALARLADARAAAAFEAGLRDADEAVRAQAAVGLARIGHPAALAALLQTLDDAPDLLHADMTPAVDELPRQGWAAAPALLDRMEKDASSLTRLHAWRAFAGLAARFGIGDASAAPYEPDAPAAARTAAVAQLRDAVRRAQKS